MPTQAYYDKQAAIAEKLTKAEGALIAALQTRLPEGYSLDNDGQALTGPQGSVHMWMDFKRETTGSRWRRELNGKLRCYIGQFGEKTCYRMKKDGTWRYDEMAADLVNRYKVRKTTEKLRDDASARRITNEGIRDRLCQEIGIPTYGPLSIDYHTGSLTLTALSALTEEQARAILETAVAVGAVRPMVR